MFARSIGGATRPIGVVYVQVGLAGCNGIIRFTVVEQEVPPLLQVGATRALQASLDLDDNGDKVIVRQFRGESSLRTLQSGHTATRADHFDLHGWQRPDSGELCQNDDQRSVTNYMSAIAHLHKKSKGGFQKHERNLWTSHRGDQPWGGSTAGSTTWELVDDQIVVTLHTVFPFRTTRGIHRYAASGTHDAEHHGTTSGYPAGSAATEARTV